VPDSHEQQLLTRCIVRLTPRSARLSAFEASMQLLGLHQPPCTAQNHERLVKVCVHPIVSLRPLRFIQADGVCGSAGQTAIHTAAYLCGHAGNLQVAGGHVGTAWFRA
jgi:hypothetical protein